MSKSGFYDVGRLLAAALVEDDVLFERVAARAGVDGGPYTDRTIDLTPWTGGGKSERPSDLLVMTTAKATGRRWGIHFRNLVRTASLRADQAADYPRRAEAMAAMRGYEDWKTVLLVNEKRFSKLQDMSGPFDAVLFHHEISDLVPIYRDAL